MTDRTSGKSRFYKSAIATTTLPLLALGSASAATAAVVDTSRTVLSPKTASAANLTAAQQHLESALVPADYIAAALPARFTQQNFQTAQTAPKTYKVKTGDTLGHIALKQKVSLSSLLKWNELKASSTIFPRHVLILEAPQTKTSSSASTSSASSSSNSQSSYKVKAGDTLSAIAARNGVSLSTLLRANNLSMSSTIYPGQRLKLSGAATSAATSSRQSSSSSSTGRGTYKVRSGDTLSGIASKNAVSLSTILKANGLSLSSTIFPGQSIKLSGSASTSSSSTSTTSSGASPSASSYTVKAGDTLSGIAARQSVSLSTVLRANGLSASSVIYPGQRIKLAGSAPATTPSSSSNSSASSATYTVKSGDTLSGIASRNSISLSALLKANGLTSTSIIYPGQSLKLSGSASSESGTVSTAASGNSGQLIGNTFLHYTYPDHVVANANANKQTLLNSPMPSRSQLRQMVRDTAVSMGVTPSLAMGHAQVESGFDPTAVSRANAIGTMQVIPSSGEWASQLVGRKLNLLDPQDNITAGVAIIRHLQRNNPGDIGIAGYYQGEAGVRRHGMYSDTKDYVAKVRSAMSRF